MLKEIDNIKARYARRKQLRGPNLYSLLSSCGYMAHQERVLTIVKCIGYARLDPINDKKVLEVGCGGGANLLQFLLMGFSPDNMTGVELLEERAVAARKILPSSVKILCGDAAEIDLQGEKFDILLQSTVFTSLLDDEFQKKLAKRMWDLVKPGGGILWYDFIYNNPKNPDVRGVPVKRIKKLFPEAKMKVWSVTLAPPISRLVTRIHPSLYTILNFFPFLRTHVLCWIGKEK